MRKAWNVAITIIALALMGAAPLVVKVPGSRAKGQQPASAVVAPKQIPAPPVTPRQDPEPPVAPKQDPVPPVGPKQDPDPPAPPPPAGIRPVGIAVTIAPPRALDSTRAKVENAWQDQLDGAWVQVFAGCIPGNQTQGVVWVVEERPDGSQKLHAYKTPAPAGSVRIVAAEGTRLTLKASDGRAFVFDVATQEFEA